MSRVHSAASRRHFSVNLTAARPRMMVSADGKGLVSLAGAVLLVQALRVTGLDRGPREVLALDGQARATRFRSCQDYRRD